MGLPVVIISTAFETGTMRGRRCVPPEPGRMPSFTSGRPSCAFGAAREGLLRADQHHRLGLRVAFGALQALQDPGAQRVAEAVDRRIVQRDDGDAVADGVWRDFAHGGMGSEGASILTR